MPTCRSSLSASSQVRNKIKDFAGIAVGQGVAGYPCPPYKLIILDEADSMTEDAQVLRLLGCLRRPRDSAWDTGARGCCQRRPASECDASATCHLPAAARAPLTPVSACAERAEANDGAALARHAILLHLQLRQQDNRRASAMTQKPLHASRCRLSTGGCTSHLAPAPCFACPRIGPCFLQTRSRRAAQSSGSNRSSRKPCGAAYKTLQRRRRARRHPLRRTALALQSVPWLRARQRKLILAACLSAEQPSSEQPSSEQGLQIAPGAMETLDKIAAGDMRKAITIMQSAASLHGKEITAKSLEDVAGKARHKSREFVAGSARQLSLHPSEACCQRAFSTCEETILSCALAAAARSFSFAQIPDQAVRALLEAVKANSFDGANTAVANLIKDGYPGLQLMLQFFDACAKDPAIPDAAKARIAVKLAEADKARTRRGLDDPLLSRASSPAVKIARVRIEASSDATVARTAEVDCAKQRAERADSSLVSFCR